MWFSGIRKRSGITLRLRTVLPPGIHLPTIVCLPLIFCTLCGKTIYVSVSNVVYQWLVITFCFRSDLHVCPTKVGRQVDGDIDIGILGVIPLGTKHIPQTEWHSFASCSLDLNCCLLDHEVVILEDTDLMRSLFFTVLFCYFVLFVFFFSTCSMCLSRATSSGCFPEALRQKCARWKEYLRLLRLSRKH